VSTFDRFRKSSATTLFVSLESHDPFGPERLAEIGSLAVQNHIAVNHDYIARRYSRYDYYSGNGIVRRSSAEHTYGRVTPLLSNPLQRANQTSADNRPSAPLLVIPDCYPPLAPHRRHALDTPPPSP